jgi:hypothetical protein
VTFDEWYESIGQVRPTTCPRDLARAAFHAGGACMRNDLEDMIADRAASLGTPVISAELHVGLRESPRRALGAWTRGVVRDIARTIGAHGAGGG